jgi:hypothetical protein
MESVTAALNIYSSLNHPRRVRPTIRYVLEDLGMDMPPLDVDLCDPTSFGVGDPCLDRLREQCDRLTENGDGCERLKLVKKPLMYRLKVNGRFRVVAWQERPSVDGSTLCEPFLTWACAWGLRKDGDPNDCYEHFKRLHNRDQLLPNQDDINRHHIELGARIISQAYSEAPLHLAAARSRRGQEVQCEIAGIEARLKLTGDPNCETLYIVLNRASLRRVGNKKAQEGILTQVFRAFEPHLALWDVIDPTEYDKDLSNHWEYAARFCVLP